MPTPEIVVSANIIVSTAEGQSTITRGTTVYVPFLFLNAEYTYSTDIGFDPNAGTSLDGRFSATHESIDGVSSVKIRVINL